jgi:hypothetical protein
VAKLEADVASLDWALKVYLSTEIRSREIGRDPELNVRDRYVKPKRRIRMNDVRGKEIEGHGLI